MSNQENTQFYTAYLVRDVVNRRYLNRQTYTGRDRTIWSKIGDSFVFHSKDTAKSCASNINRRSPGSSYARVVPVLIKRRAP